MRESDLSESFARSGGSGGQNMNKVSTCVWLKHGPTGLEVKCQATRFQGMNRFLAKRLLLDKIESLQKGEASARERAFEKIRRQKRKRSRRAKEKMLDAKRVHSDKKALRRRPAED